MNKYEDIYEIISMNIKKYRKEIFSKYVLENYTLLKSVHPDEFELYQLYIFERKK